MNDAHDERIERLEERFAFLEHDVEQMSQVLRTLGEQSDAMSRHISRLRSEIRAAAATNRAAPSAGDSASSTAPEAEPDGAPELPPHWGRRPGDA